MKINLRKSNGFAGIDISISMIIILIFIPTVFGIVYNIGKTNAEEKRKSTAVGIITNVLETIKGQDYENVDVSANKLNSDISKIYQVSNYKNTEKEESGYNYTYYSYVDEDDVHYQIQIGIKNYYPSDTENQDLIKQVKVRVFYLIGDKLKDIDIGMVVQNI